MLTGRAAANVFNGDIECNKSGRKLVNDELHSVFCFVLVAVFYLIFVWQICNDKVWHALHTPIKEKKKTFSFELTWWLASQIQIREIWIRAFAKITGYVVFLSNTLALTGASPRRSITGDRQIVKDTWYLNGVDWILWSTCYCTFHHCLTFFLEFW